MVRKKAGGKTPPTAPASLSAPGTIPGLVPREDMDFDEWKQLVRRLKAEGKELLRRTTIWQFEVGDAVKLGESRYGNPARKFIEEEGFTYTAVRQYAWVARRIPLSRRRPNVPFAHHRLVATLPGSQQEEWLAKVEANALPVRALRKMIRSAGGLRRRPRRFGGPLNFRGLQYEPISELGVVFLFGMVATELGFHVEAVAGDFPDCTAKRKQPGGYYEQVEIEFEFKASNFRLHEHDRDTRHCDLLVCWENDWPDCPFEIVELKEAIKKL